MSISKNVIKQCLINKLITYDEECVEEEICVVPVWKWLLKE